MMTNEKQMGIRRRNFEAHVTECEYCQSPIDNTPGGAKPVLCRPGEIILANFMRAIKAVKVGV